MRLLIILVGLTMTWYKKKYEFPPDAYVVSCPAPAYMSVIIYFSGLYPWTSLMSHHCTANTKITTREDFSYVCTSTVLIPAGEEIVTNYVWVHHMCSRILSFLFLIVVFLRKSCRGFREKITSYIGMSIPKWKPIQNRSKQTINFMEKNQVS